MFCMFVVFRYCPLCKNDASQVVMAGEKLKHSKKKAKMASSINGSTRDWGKVRIIPGAHLKRWKFQKLYLEFSWNIRILKNTSQIICFYVRKFVKFPK